MGFDAFYAALVTSFRLHSEPQFKHLLRVVLRFLVAFTQGSDRNQRLVTPEQETWTRLMGVPGLDADAASLMTVLIEGNADLADDVSEAWLDKVMRYLRRRENKEPAWLTYLATAACTQSMSETVQRDRGKVDYRPHIRTGDVVMRGVQQMQFLHVFCQREVSPPSCPASPSSPPNRNFRNTQRQTQHYGICPDFQWETLSELLHPSLATGDEEERAAYMRTQRQLEFHYKALELLASLCEGQRPENELLVESALPWHRMVDG